MSSATLLICDDRGRAGLFARAERSLPQGWVLAQVKDIVGRKRACRTVPISPRAELVANEPPLVMRGGLTILVSYYRVPADELGAREEHSENGTATHGYDVSLRVACKGRAASRALVA